MSVYIVKPPLADRIDILGILVTANKYHLGLTSIDTEHAQDSGDNVRTYLTVFFC